MRFLVNSQFYFIFNVFWIFNFFYWKIMIINKKVDYGIWFVNFLWGFSCSREPAYVSVRFRSWSQCCLRLNRRMTGTTNILCCYIVNYTIWIWVFCAISRVQLLLCKYNVCFASFMWMCILHVLSCTIFTLVAFCLLKNRHFQMKFLV